MFWAWAIVVLALACIATWRSHESHDAKAETTPMGRVLERRPSVADAREIPVAVDTPLAVQTLPPVAPSVAPQESSVSAAAVGTLVEPLDALLDAAGWPAELWEQAKRVIACESHGNPNAVGDSGRSVGLFQLNKATWFTYAGEDPDQWADPLVNARTALIVVHYDIEHGYAPFKQWTCSPN